VYKEDQTQNYDTRRTSYTPLPCELLLGLFNNLNSYKVQQNIILSTGSALQMNAF